MFAVVLPPKDFWRILGPSEADVLKAGFPELVVVPAADHGAHEFEEPVALHTLYALLPKEQLFVKAEHYPERCLFSEIGELLWLFAHLGAANVRWRGEVNFRIGGAVQTEENVWDLYSFGAVRTHFFHLESRPDWYQLVHRRLTGLKRDQYHCATTPLPDAVLAAMKTLKLGNPPTMCEVAIGVTYN
jgi:hypothetical protein